VNAATILPPPPARPFKACGCGRTYDVLAWKLLPLCCERWDTGEEVLELRHCACHSTLAVEVPS
jgi:hypothetical protein